MKPGWSAEHPQRADNWSAERDVMLWLTHESIEQVIEMYEQWIRGDDRPQQRTWWDRIKSAFRALEYGRCHHGVNTFREACPTCLCQHRECVDYLQQLKPRVLQFYRSREFWLQLNGLDFEYQITQLFQRLGRQAELTRSTGDWGVDIFIRDPSGLTAVQCKAQQGAVGPAIVRDLYGAMTHFRAARGMIISTGGYTAGARQFALGKPIDLLDLDEVLALHQRTIEPL